MIVPVGAINAGTKYNAIPDETLLKVGVRTLDENVRAKVKKTIERIAAAELAASGVPHPPEIIQAETARFSRLEDYLTKIWKSRCGTKESDTRDHQPAPNLSLEQHLQPVQRRRQTLQ
jgi:metal-dependent amidase/aminoacylase/carboxypeptidase family protein